MENDFLYQLALSRIHGIGPVNTRKLIRFFGEARPVFQADKALLEEICGKKNAEGILRFHEFQALEKEQTYLEQHDIRPLFITGKHYPERLLNCENVPALLFYRGNADLNTAKIIAVVGTRTPTDYGRQVVRKFIKELAAAGQATEGPLVVSGLAYGIDAMAHQAALDHHLPTIGVLGHGLDRIYPVQNTTLAAKMENHGGLLTGFPIGTGPESHNFPLRNRIVAGMIDALVVVETDLKGGSMLTVGDALAAQKKVFALPGRVTDSTSSGCNVLIQKDKASLLTDARQFMEEMKWGEPAKQSSAEQASLFPASDKEQQLSAEEKKLLALFRKDHTLFLDQLITGNSQYNTLTLSLLNLELEGWIDSLPGKRYRLRE